MKNNYAQRRFLRTFEKIWSRVDGVLNRLVSPEFNPFYHLGTLSTFLVIVLIVTGTYLTFFYRLGTANAYSTVQALSANWLGSWMRSVHRYTTTALVVTIILHFLKMLFSDRYWGTRWVAWTSGWVLLGIVWIIAVTGYWLVWDSRAQWITETFLLYMGDATVVPFLDKARANYTFYGFWFMLLVHITLAVVIFLGIAVHYLRLARARWWTPRWLMLEATLALGLLGLLKPVASGAPADLNHMISATTLDGLNLGIFALADKWGDQLAFGLAFLLFGALFSLPWLARNRQHQTAQVIVPNCTGCVLCANECPYEAITMVNREDDSGYRKLAVINSARCTACGICLGACPSDAIQFGEITSEKVFAHTKSLAERELQAGRLLAVVFATQRHLALQGLPTSLAQAAQKASVSLASWGTDSKVISVLLPSASTVNAEWLKALEQLGVQNIILLSSPFDDGIYREDSFWILERLRLRRNLVTSALHWLEVTPSDPKPLTHLLNELQNAKQPSTPPILPQIRKRNLFRPSLKAGAIGVLALFLLFLPGLFSDIPAGRANAALSAMRVVLDAKAKVATLDIPAGFTPPPGANIEAVYVGTYFPIEVQIKVDGNVLWQQTYQMYRTGVGHLSWLKYFTVTPETHQVEILLKDSDQPARVVFSGTVEFPAGQVLLFEYDRLTDSVQLRQD